MILAAPSSAWRIFLSPAALPSDDTSHLPALTGALLACNTMSLWADALAGSVNSAHAAPIMATRISPVTSLTNCRILPPTHPEGILTTRAGSHRVRNIAHVAADVASRLL